MPWVSRRNLISAGVAVGATALVPPELFPYSVEFPAPVKHSVPDSRKKQAEQFPYSTGVQAKILGLAQRALTLLFAGKTLLELQSVAGSLRLPPAQRVNVTLRSSGRMRGSMSAPGANLCSQVINSVYSAAMDASYGGRLTKWEAQDAILEVWIQVGSSEVGRDARLAGNVLLLGIDGVEIESRGRFAYFLPSVPITSRFRTDTALFGALCEKAGLEPDAWQQADVIVRKTHWICLPSVSNAQLLGQESVAESKLPIPLAGSIDESASYLIRNQDASGRTVYLYDPIADLFVGKTTNIIRSAGCLFALSQVLDSDHRLAHDAAFKACTVKMARGLLNLAPLTGDGMRILREERAAKTLEEQTAGELPGDEEADWDAQDGHRKAEELPSIGATALLAAALSGDVLRREFAQEFNQLYRAIVSAQRPDGRFFTHFGETQINERDANFYPGEALLALAMEAERKNADALERCRRAFQPYALQFRTAPTSAFTVWHVNVWSRMALLTGEHAYADFVFVQADWLLQLQIKSHRDARWVGGFSQSGAAPQIYSVAFTEAVVRALTLAIRIGDTERARRYADCVRSGLRFCNLLRLEETQATLLGNPLRCRGGVAFSLTDRRIRCDSVQHFITLCLAVQQIKDHLLLLPA